MAFQKIVVIIAILSLIGALTFIGYAMYNKQHNGVFPPVINQCPDGWEAKDKSCHNTKSLGTSATGDDNSVNFNTTFFQGHNGNCRKSNWAKRCGIEWNGITNNPNICSQ